MIELGRCTRRLRTDEGDAARARDLLLKVMGKGGKDRVRQLRHDNADRRGAGCVLAGWTVVAQLVDRCENPAARVLGDLADAVENARNSCGRYAGVGRNVGHACAIFGHRLNAPLGARVQLFPYKCNSLHTIAKIVAETKLGVLQ